MAGEDNLAGPRLKITPWFSIPTFPNQWPSQESTFYTLQFLTYGPDKILKVKVTTTRSNQGHTMTLHTYTPNQCPSQISTSCTLQFLRYSPDKILKVKVTTTMVWHTAWTNFFTLPMPTHPDPMGENNTHTALKGCGVKMLASYRQYNQKNISVATTAVQFWA